MDGFKLNWRNWSLIVKITLTTTAMIVMVVVSVTLLSIRREQQTFRKELEQQAKLLLDTLEVAVADPLYYLDTDYLSDLMEAFGEDQQILLSGHVYDAEGRIVADAYDEGLSYGLKVDCSAVRRSFVECDKWLSGIQLGIVDCTDSSLTTVHRLHDLARNTKDSVPDTVPGVESSSCSEHGVRATRIPDSLRGGHEAVWAGLYGARGRRYHCHP